MADGNGQSGNRVQGSEAAAGAGLAALAILSRLIGVLVAKDRLLVSEVREAVDDALLALEHAEGDSPVKEANACARQCLESVIAMLPATPVKAGGDHKAL